MWIVFVRIARPPVHKRRGPACRALQILEQSRRPPPRRVAPACAASAAPARSQVRDGSPPTLTRSGSMYLELRAADDHSVQTDSVAHAKNCRRRGSEQRLMTPERHQNRSVRSDHLRAPAPTGAACSEIPDTARRAAARFRGLVATRARQRLDDRIHEVRVAAVRAELHDVVRKVGRRA